MKTHKLLMILAWISTVICVLSIIGLIGCLYYGIWNDISLYQDEPRLFWKIVGTLFVTMLLTMMPIVHVIAPPIEGRK